MARISDEDFNGGTGGGEKNAPQIIQAGGKDTINLPDADFIKNADMSRDGQDLVLEGPDGSVIIIEGYFAGEFPPMLVSPEGLALTPGLVHSFLTHAGNAQFAQAGSLDDESAIGIVKEASGHATVTHADGSVETITIGTAIYEGDIVETDADGAVNIVFIDESSFAVSDNAKLAIDEYVFDPSSESGTTNVSMLRGMFMFTSGLIGREDPDDVQIDTPMGSIGIRGTIIAGNVSTGEISVLEGAIVLRGFNGNEMTLADQFETARFDPGGGNIIYMGKPDPEAFMKNFTHIKNVAPHLFSGINRGDDGQKQNGEDSTQQKAGDDSNSDNTDSTNTEDTGAQNENQQQGAGQENGGTPSGDGTQEGGNSDPSQQQQQEQQQDTQQQQTDTFLDGSQSGSNTFDSAAGTNTGGTGTASGGTGTVPGTTSGGTASGSGTSGSGTSDGTTTTTATATTTNSDQPPPPPPPGGAAAPVIGNGGTTLATIIESAAKGTIVGKVNATDSDGDRLTYSITSGNANNAFSIDSMGNIKVNGTLDYETLNNYNLTVRVSDGGHTTAATYTINIANTNDAPVFTGTGPFSVNENSAGAAAVGTVTATDADLNTVSFSETGGGTGAGLFSIDAAGNITVTSASTLDHETVTSYTYEVMANDGNGGTTTSMITININDLDDVAPTQANNTGTTLSEGASKTVTAAMLDFNDPDTADANITFTVNAIPANGVLKLNGNALAATETFTMADINAGLVTYHHNGTDTATDSFTFSVSDGTNTPVTGQTFSITVSATDDAPVFSSGTAFSLNENEANGTTTIDIDADDGDGGTVDTGVTYSIFSGNTDVDGDGTNAFTIDSAGIISIVDSGDLDYEQQTSFSLVIRASDGSNTTDQTITISINDISPEIYTGTAGNDRTYGGAGADTFNGLGGNDVLYGGGGNDTFNYVSSDGADTYYGEDGDDTFTVGNNNGNDTIYGGTTGESSGDTYNAAAATISFTYDLNANGDGTAAKPGTSTTDTFYSIENVVSGTANDTFNVNDANYAYTLDGGSSGDTDTLSFAALGNNVEIDLTTGIASINGGASVNFSNMEAFVGGSGNDSFVFDNASFSDLLSSKISITGGSGTDTLDATAVTGNQTFDMALGVYDNIDKIVAGSDSYTFMAADNDGAQIFDATNATSDSNYDAQNVTNDLVFDMQTGGNTVTVNDGNDIDTAINIQQIRGGLGQNTYVAHDDDGDMWFTMENNAGTHIYDASNVTYNVTVDEVANKIMSGSDTDLYVSTELDAFIGGVGDDTFEAYNGDKDGFSFDGGGGNNTYDASSSTDDLTFDLTSEEVYFNTSANTHYVSNVSTYMGGAGNDVFIVDGYSFDIHGGNGNDKLVIQSGGIFDLSSLSMNSIEIIEAKNQATTLNIDIDSSLFANDSGDLTVEVDDSFSDIITLDFTTFGGGGGFSITAGDLTGGLVTFTNSMTGNSITVDYDVNDTLNIIGAIGLDLNSLTVADGFWVTDSVANGFGDSAVSVGDRNGDGYDDMLITRADGNAVFSLDGGNALGNMAATSDASITSTHINGTVSDMTVSMIGDFDGDGDMDYIFGSPTADDASSTSGSGQASIIDQNGNLVMNLKGLVSGDWTGESVTGIGDINHDGYADVLVGAPFAGNGQAYILFGHPVAPSTSLDVTAMELPKELGNIGTPFTAALDVAIARDTASGTVAYVYDDVGGNGTIRAIDVSDPGAPTVIAGGNINNSVVNGMGAYTGAGGLSTALSSTTDIAVQGNLLYVLSSNVSGMGQITVFDISNPNSPVFIDLMKNAALQYAAAIDVDLKSNQLVVTTNNGAGSQVIKIDAAVDGRIGSAAIGDYTTANLSAGTANLSGANEIVINGNYAYIAATDANKVNIVNLSTMALSSAAFGSVDHIFIDKGADILYAMSSSTGQIRSYDISVPNAPSMIGGFTDLADLGGATDFAVAGRMIYVTTSSGVQVIDAHNPALMTSAGLLPNTGNTADNASALAVDSKGILHVITDDTFVSYDIRPEGLTLEGGASNLLGMDAAAAGDFDGDGFSDFMVSEPGADQVHLYFGSKHFNGSDKITISNVTADASGNEIPVFYLGDMNGDGYSDIAVASDSGTGEIGIFFGGAARTNLDFTTDADIWIAADANHKLVGGNGIGDFNGDGYDDAVVVMQGWNGTNLQDNVDIFVVYGSDSVTGTLDMNDLLNADTAYHITYTVPAGADPDNFSFEITRAGDINGDGYYDIFIGLPEKDTNTGVNSDASGGNDDDDDGAFAVVYGLDATGSNIAGSSISASANGDVLVGTSNAGGSDLLASGTYDDVVFRAGTGNDSISLMNLNFADIDGGAGHDKLDLTFMSGTIDFYALNLGSEEISRIEEIYSGSGSSHTLTLSLENIFSMLQSSDTGTLKIDFANPGVGNLHIVDTAGGHEGTMVDQNQLAGLFGATGPVTSTTDFYQFEIGGYTLEIDKVLIDSDKVNIT